MGPAGCDSLLILTFFIGFSSVFPLKHEELQGRKRRVEVQNSSFLVQISSFLMNKSKFEFIFSKQFTCRGESDGSFQEQTGGFGFADCDGVRLVNFQGV